MRRGVLNSSACGYRAAIAALADSDPVARSEVSGGVEFERLSGLFACSVVLFVLWEPHRKHTVALSGWRLLRVGHPRLGAGVAHARGSCFLRSRHVLPVHAFGVFKRWLKAARATLLPRSEHCTQTVQISEVSHVWWEGGAVVVQSV